MYAVSNLWNTLIGTDKHWFETQVKINNVVYGQNVLASVSVQNTMFSEEHPSVGGCLSGEISLQMLAPAENIPRMAKIEPFVRVCAGNQTSEWVPQGVYFIDTRETTRNDDGMPVLTIHGFDSMLKTEGDFPDTSVSFPQTDISVVGMIATEIGVGIDPRTTALMTNGYEIGLPVGYSMREVLSYIGSMYAGNWIMNFDGDLLLVAVNGIPPETNYLVDSLGEAITFGGDRILV